MFNVILRKDHLKIKKRPLINIEFNRFVARVTVKAKENDIFSIVGFIAKFLYGLKNTFSNENFVTKTSAINTAKKTSIVGIAKTK